MTRFSSADPWLAPPNAAPSKREYVSPSSRTSARIVNRSVSSVRIRRYRGSAQRVRDARFFVLRVVVRVDVERFFIAPLDWDMVFLLPLGLALGFTRSGSSLLPAPRFHLS